MRAKKLFILVIFFAGCEGGSLSTIPENGKQFSEISIELSSILESEGEEFAVQNSFQNFAGFTILSHQNLTTSNGAQITISDNSLSVTRSYTNIEIITFNINAYVDGQIIELGEIGTALFASSSESGSGQEINNSFYAIEYPETYYTSAQVSLTHFFNENRYSGTKEGDSFDRSGFSIGYSFSGFSLNGFVRTDDFGSVHIGEFKGSGFIYTNN